MPGRDGRAVKSDGWVPARDVRNYADGHLTVTITLAEYRELVAYRAAREAMDDDEERGHCAVLDVRRETGERGEGR